jgi:large subunit ribosomal protein L24
MAMQKIKKGDEVIVIAGKDKGRTGTVTATVKCAAGKLQKVVVEGINTVKKHVKANPNANQEGSITTKEMPIHVSNVALRNSATGKADRVKIKTLADGKKVRCFKSNDEAVDI